MSADNFTGQNISGTYQRLLQLSDNDGFVINGTGSRVDLLRTTSSYALTASYVPGVTVTTPGGDLWSIQFNSASTFQGSNKLLFNSVSSVLTLTGSLFTTGSNTFIGTQTVTGSLFTTGSNTLIGNTTLTGSLSITGSTLQVGSNTLYGDTLLSGSITISGSHLANTPTIRVYGDMETDGVIKFLPVSYDIDPTISGSYIFVSGSTDDLYFSQNGAGFSNTTRLRWLEGNLYTGLLNGGLLSIVNTNTYRISSGSGIIVNLNGSYSDNPYPIIEYLNWGNITNTIDALSGSFDQQFVAISSSAGTPVIKAQGTPYDNGDYNEFIPIGIVLHQNRSTINGVQTFPGTAYGWKQRSYDFIKAFGALKVSGYTLAQSGSSARGLALSGGVAWVEGRNYTNDPNSPSYIVEATGITTSKIFRYYQSGSNWQSNWGYNTNGGAGFTDIDPTQYSNAGTLTSVGSNKWTIQRVYYFPNSATKALFVYYGNAEYANEADALAAVTTEPFTEAPNTAASAIYVGYMLLRNDAIFTLPVSYTFYQAGLFRGSGTGGAGGGGASTLAGLTDVSISSVTNGDLLKYNSTTGLWNNTKTLSGSYTLSGSLVTNDGVWVQSLTASFISASSGITGSLFGTASYADRSFRATEIGDDSYQIDVFEIGYGISQPTSDSVQLYNIQNTPIATVTIDNVANAANAGFAITATNADSASYVNTLSQTVVVSGSVDISGSLFLNGVAVGSSGTETDPVYTAEKSTLARTGSNQFNGNQTITGSLDVSGSFGLYSFGTAAPISSPTRPGLLYFTNTDLYISLD